MNKELKKEIIAVFKMCDICDDKALEANINFRTFLIANFSKENIKVSFPELWKYYELRKAAN